MQLSSTPASRHEKFRWVLPKSHHSQFIDSIPSKRFRKFARNLDQILAKNNITYHDLTMTQKMYLDWLKPYSNYMESKKYRILATPRWYQNRVAEGSEIRGLYFYQADNLVGSELYRCLGKEYISSAFRFSNPEVKLHTAQGSLGAAMDLIYFRLALAGQYTNIYKGRSSNAFGILNTFGNLIYKMRFGLLPTPDWKTGQVTDIPRSSESSTLFFSFEDEQPQAYIRQISNHNIDQELFKYLAKIPTKYYE